MDMNILAIVGFAVMLVFIFLGMPFGAAMALVGFAGMFLIIGPGPALTRLATTTFTTSSIYQFTVVPLFILMGFLAAGAGLGADIFEAAHKWLGRLRGGLATGTILGGSVFGAVCGDSTAGMLTMATIALPEMRKYNYDDKLSVGSIAVGGLLSIMIPPSLAFILFSLITNEPLGLLFAAGVLPGLVIAGCCIVAVLISCAINPSLGPQGPKTSWKEKLRSLKYSWTIVLVFVAVLAGIYLGIFTPTEGGAEGAFAVLVFGLMLQH